MSLHRNKLVHLALLILLVLLIIVVSGCPAVGPDYVRPDTTVYKNWNTQIKNDSGVKRSGCRKFNKLVECSWRSDAFEFN